MSCLCPSAPRSHHFECRNARNPFRTATRPPSARTELATELHRLQAGGVQQLADRAAVEELAALRAELAAADAAGDAWAPTGAADGLYARSWALDDVQILRTTDGRTVAAYAAVFDTPKVDYPPLRARTSGGPEPIGTVALSHLGEDERSAQVYERSALLAGDEITGPAIVREPNSTTHLRARQTLTVGGHGELIITVSGGDR